MKKKIIYFSLANLFSALLSMLGSFWAANLAGPSLMGVFNSLQLLVTYSPILAFGVFNGLNRELPYSIGKGNYEEANTLVSVSLYVCCIISLIFFICMLIASFGAWVLHKPIWFYGLAVFSLIIPLSLLKIFTEITYRTAHDFEWLSVVKVITGILGIVLVPLLYMNSWGGLLGRALILIWIGFYLLWYKRKFREKSFWSIIHFRKLITIGLPIFIVGYIYTLFTSIDRFIIISKISVEALGSYTPALLILQGMLVLPSSVAQVVYPRAAERYGRDNSLRPLLPMLFLPVLWMAVIQLPFLLLGWHYIDEIVLRFMPKFQSGIGAARWSLLVGFVLSLNTPAIIYNVARHQRMYGGIMLLSILTTAIVWISYGYRLGLVGVSISILYGGGVFVTVSAVGAWFLCKRVGSL